MYTLFKLYGPSLSLTCFIDSCLKLGPHSVYISTMGFRTIFSRGGGNVSILLILVRLLTIQYKYTKRFTVSTKLRHKENAPCYDNSHKNALRRSHSQVYIMIIFQ